jgi:uncharacterized protein YuzE
VTDEPALDCGFLSLPQDIQDALTAEPEPSGRTRIEIVGDDLGREVTVDYEADMAYFELCSRPLSEPPRTVEITDGVVADYNAAGELVGVEVFLIDGAVLAEDVAAVKRLLGV